MCLTDAFPDIEVSLNDSDGYDSNSVFEKMTQCQMFFSVLRGYDIMSIIMKLGM